MMASSSRVAPSHGAGSSLATTIRRTMPSRVAVLASAAPLAAPVKALKQKKSKDGLYLLQWRSSPQPASGDQPADPKALMALRDRLKVLEKVSKDSLWFTVRDGEDGAQHVLVVTNDAKKARKYGLIDLADALGTVQAPGDEAPVTSLKLEGLPQPVDIPVATLRANLQQRMMEEDSSDSESEDEDCGPNGKRAMPVSAGVELATKEEDKKKIKDEKKRIKEEEKRAKLGAKVVTALKGVEEDPRAAEQAAALLGLAGGQGSSQGGAIKLSDVVKQLSTTGTVPALEPKPVCEKEESSSSSSGSSSSEDEEDCTVKAGAAAAPAGLKVQPLLDGRSSESESGSEEKEKGKA